MIHDTEARIWAMEPRALETWLAREKALDPVALGPMSPSSRPRGTLQIVDGVAEIQVSGPLMKSVPEFARMFGIEATSYVDLAAALVEAAASPDVKSVLLRVDSPGGEISGLDLATRAIAATRKQKPVDAHVDGLAASGAYWLASQAGRITAEQNSEIGSIGVYTRLMDTSKMAEMDGVKVHLIASGPHKGAGSMGVPVTDAQVAAMQEVVDGLAENFTAAVASGRGMALEKAKELSSGRLWTAQQAKAAGLIDHVGPVERAQGAAGGAAPASATACAASMQEGNMPENQGSVPPAPPAATPAKADNTAEILAALKDMGIADLKAQVAELKAAVAAKPPVARGAEPVPAGNEGAASGATHYDPHARAKAIVASSKVSFNQALRQVRAEDPETFDAWLSENYVASRKSSKK